MNLEDRYLKPLEELQYAELKEKQEKKLRELEKEFNNEFSTDFYFMVMKRNEKNQR